MLWLGSILKNCRFIEDIQRIGTKFGAISEPEFAINQTWVKIHVSNGYHKRFWTMLRYGPIQWKNHALIVVMSLQISHGIYTLFLANFFVGLRA